jgi:hypothetical protein
MTIGPEPMTSTRLMSVRRGMGSLYTKTTKLAKNTTQSRRSIEEALVTFVFFVSFVMNYPFSISSRNCRNR